MKAAKETLTGEGVSPGVGQGRVWRGDATLAKRAAAYVPGTSAQESEKLSAASRAAAVRMNQRAKELRARGEMEAAGIMEAHALLAEDPVLLAAIEKELARRKNAPEAVRAAAKEQAAVLAGLEDAYIRERAADVRAVGKALARELLGVEEEIPADGLLVLAGNDAAPEAFDELPPGRLGGMILRGGSRTCHAAILARSRGIPAVVAFGETLDELAEGEMVIVDGNAGTVTVSPTSADLADAAASAKAWQEKQYEAKALAGEAAVTTDGCLLSLGGNVGSAEEVGAAVRDGADSIGLFRSEFLFLGRSTLPSEEEQYEAYRAALKAAEGRSCIIRTLDAGGDKTIPALPLPSGANPALGQRAIRISLARPDIFRVQLRAILRAGTAGAVGILLPLVVSRAEVTAVKTLLAEVKAELAAENIPFAAHVPLGLTVETPAVAIMADRLAKEVDFFSIGTNDLTQYTLAADRTNPAVSALGDYFHPAVLRLIAQTAAAGQKAGIPVTVCGEMAGDPLALPLLLAMGVKILSMAPASLLGIKAAIHKLSRAQAENLWSHVQTLDDAGDIRAFLQKKMADDARGEALNDCGAVGDS